VDPVLNSDAKMLVADGVANLIRVLDRDGKSLGCCGEKGNGPTGRRRFRRGPGGDSACRG
jgi:hypothetical protein